MKALVQRLYATPRFSKMAGWGKAVSLTASAQALVQVLGFICGIIIIRLLPTKEYALYTLANTMLGTLTVLSDAGISSSVMSESATVWKDRNLLGIVIVTGLNLRKRFSLFISILAFPILFYLLLHHRAGILSASLIVLSLLPAFYASLSDTILQVGPKMHQSIAQLQKNQIEAVLGRLVLTFSFVAIFPWSFLAIVASGIPRIIANHRLKDFSKYCIDFEQPTSPVVEKKIKRMVRRLLPESIYYCLSGQFTIWAVSILGSTVFVAELGALNRITALTAMLIVIFNTVVTPRFAKLQDPRQTFRRFIQIQSAVVLLGSLVVLISWLLSSQILWLLGPSYSGLKLQLILVTICSCLNFFYTSVYSLSISKGIVVNPIVFISTSLLTLVIASSLLKISTLDGVILINMVVLIVQVLIVMIYFILNLKRE